ncbi:MAG: 50S ribosomal protein L11 methyltransferase [Lachnospiraceae bacterium]|nr:50S ribosomal protein L11 methyltransferase [Lachnospiraceae bacterium]
MVWTKLTIDTTVEVVDILSAFLDDLGVEGIMIEDNVPLTEEEKQAMFVDIPLIEGEDDGTAKVSCFIDDSFDLDTLKADIVAELTRLEEFLPVGTKDITLSNTEDKDWINNWKQFFKPFRLYDNIVIKPTWEELNEVNEGDMIVEIDPGIAFGTGSHETTKLCIGQLKKYLKPGDTVFDVGSGSGILSIISVMLGAGFVHGMDIDEVAVRASIENREVNNMTDKQLVLTCGNLLAGDDATNKMALDVNGGNKYDIVVANILADVIIPLSGVVKPFIKDDGYFITSGIIDMKEEAVKEALISNGFEILDIVHMNDWVSIIAKIA